MNKLLSKLIALILVFILVSANLVILGEFTISKALSDEELNDQTSSTSNRNVEFNSYFNGNSHNALFDIGSEDAKLYLDINVKEEGYLKDAVVEFQDTNFKLKDGITNDNIQSINTENNRIVLNQLNNGSSVVIELPIEILNKDSVSSDYFNKETKTVLTGTYVDGDGEEHEIEKEIINKLSWKGTAEAELTLQTSKYAPYATGGEYGVILQTLVNSKVKDNSLPINTTNIEVMAPEINNMKPTSVTVIATNTSATNGKTDGLDFGTENYTYDAEQGKVTINNSNNADNVSWMKNSTDEYLVTYLYEGQEIYNYARENGISTNVTANSNISVYNGEVTTLNQTASLEINQTETVGTIGDFAIEVPQDISKGYIYANFNTDSKVETEYYTNYIATISSTKLTTSLEFTQSYDKFLTEEDAEGSTTVNSNNYAYNKEVRINQSVFNKILGEDGNITVKDENGTELGIINKDTEVDNGEYVLDISTANNNKLVITTSAPIMEGQLELTVVRALKGNIGYSKTQMQDFTKMESELVGKTNTTTITTRKQFLMKEPETKVEFEINKTDFTTVVENENIEMRAILDTSSEYNALFQNPTLKITLPSYIEEINLNSTNILLDSGLEIKNTNITRENGHIVINIELEGIQTAYAINAEYKGAIVVLDMDFTVETLTPSTEDKITLEYTNENDVATNATGTIEQEVNFVAPTGVVAANGISNYADGAQDILSISDEAQTVNIDTYSDKRVATMEGTIINNYANNISNIVVLGRIPAQGNKRIDTETEMGSTFTIPLSTGIGTSGVTSDDYTVYYSDNANATRDLEDSSNGWNTTAMTTSKSYMIVFNDDYVMNAGDRISFSYDMELPENLAPNNDTYGMYKVYYTNNSDIGDIEESKNSAVIGLTTGQGPILEVELSTDSNVVKEGQYIKIYATVRNVGETDAANVVLNATAPEFTTLQDYATGNGFFESSETSQSIEIGTIKAGESATAEYFLKIDDEVMDELSDEEADNMTHDEMEDFLNSQLPRDIIISASVTTDDLEGEIKSNDYTLTIQDGNISMSLYSDVDESEILLRDEEIGFTINLSNITSQEGNADSEEEADEGDLTESLTNTIVSINLPEELEFIEGTISDSLLEEGTSEGISYDQNSNILTFNVGDLFTNKYIKFNTRVVSDQSEFSIQATATADNVEEHYSNILNFEVDEAKLSISELTSSPRYVKESQNVTYTFSITNEGSTAVTNLRITDELPEYLEYVQTTYNYAGQEYSNTTLVDGKISIQINQIRPGETITFNIIAKARLLPNTDDMQITNSVKISANSFDEVETNTVTNIIEYYEDAHHEQEEGGGEDNPGSSESRYRITGTAWLDEDMDGMRDNDEQTLSGIQVILVYRSNSQVVLDPNDNSEKITTTSENGTYTFTNIPNGEYLVIFVYDSSNYSLTDYQKEGVDSSYNSDVIDINLTLNGERRIAAITDIITVNNDNVRDIDIGMYTASRFDLRLDKYVDKITLTTPTIGTRVDEFDSNLAKEEVLERNVGQSSLVIEYRIVVTNEGSVPGYVNKIVDYLPEEASFATDLNPDWYLSENGNIYNASLTDEKINPGESKEVTLIVSVRFTEEALGTLVNTAEIYESYNELGLQDIDSTAGNGIDTEDDISRADVILSIVTGRAVLYTSIALMVVAMLGFGIFEIKRQVLDKKKNK